jgi:hypothetical protein
MKKALLLAFILLPSVFALTEIVVSSAGVPSMAEPDGKIVENECNLTAEEMDAIKSFAASSFGISASLINVSNSHCYNYSGQKSIYANLITKVSESDILIKSISFSMSSYETIDYDFLMEGKSDYFDYTLKNKYYSYKINSTDEEYYIGISYYYDENYSSNDFREDLLGYYESIAGEKYYFDDYGYPAIVFKAKTSELLSIIPGFKSQISYYGSELSFTFTGNSQGNYDLATIAKTNNCNIISGSRYYDYDSFSDECYGSYIDKERIYFSVSDYSENYSMYLSLYGIKGYKAEISAGYYGEVSEQEVIEFINDNLGRYFPGIEYSPVFEKNYESYYYSSIVKDFVYDNSIFLGLNVSIDRQNTNYYSDDVYVSVIEPHISLYSSSERILSLDSKILPPFYGRSTIITKDNVYSLITIKENDENLAKTGLNEMLSGVVQTNDWNLNMSLRQYSYYRGIEYASDSVKAGLGEQSSANTFMANLVSSFDESNFEGLESNDSVWESIVGFFSSLLGQ